MIVRLARLAMVLYLAIVTSVAFGETRKALVIGVSDYPNYSDNPIKFAHIDALRFKEFLESDRAGRVEVKALTNGEATRDAIWDAVESLKNEQPRPDTVFVFFSGHAELDSDTEQLYLMPTAGDRKRLSATAILASEFIMRLKAVGPTNLLIFLDACHSGAVILGKGGPDSNESVPGSLDATIASLNKGNEGGVMAFVSAAKDERSWEDEDNGQGIFTRFVIKGLEGEADGVGDKKDGMITAGELQNFLVREVPNRAQALSKSAQHPVVSPDFKSAYVIALAPSSPPSSSGAITGFKVPDIPRLQAVNPELALMVHAGALKLTSPALTWSGDSPGIIRSFEMARALRMGTLPASIRPESLISPVISGDGSILLACLEPSSLVWISLKSAVKVGKLPLELAGSNARSKSRILDSCDISISRDLRYAVVRSRTIDGGSRLSLANLEGEAPPPLAVTGYESGVFLGDMLLLSKGGTVTVVGAGTWATLLTKDLLKPIRDIAVDAESNTFVVFGDDRTVLYALDVKPNLSVRQGVSSRAMAPCYPTGDSLYCVSENGWYFGAPMRGGSISVCNPGGPRGFPSSSIRGAPGWALLFECAGDPGTLYLARDIVSSSPLRMPEPVLAARLLASGKVAVVGQRGGIYAFDSVIYGDCCTLQYLKPGVKTQLSAGNNGVTAVLERDPSVGTLAIFHGHNLIKTLTLSDVGWADQIMLSESNRIVGLLGESRVRLIEFAGDDYKSIRERNFDCGAPAAIDKGDSSFVCVVPETVKIQQRSVATGRVKREFDQHLGPLQQIYLTDTTITAVGAFTGRSQTLVTVWNASDGKVVSQRTCPAGAAQPRGALWFLRRGHYFTRLDTTSRLITRESLTCESSSLSVYGLVNLLRGASASDWIVLSNEPNTRFVVLNPWDAYAFSSDLELAIEDVAIAPDGADVVVVVGGRVLRIPITKAGYLGLVKQRIPREFSAQECDEFFRGVSCPKLKQ